MYTFFHHLVIEKKGIRETVLIKLKNMNKKNCLRTTMELFFLPCTRENEQIEEND